MAFAGLSKDAEEALVTLVAAYTDGYKVTVVETHGTARFAAYATVTDTYDSVLIYGRGTMTATKPGAFGAYVVETTFADDTSSDGKRDSSLVATKAGFMGTASTTWDTHSAAYDSALVAEDVTKYGFTMTGVPTTDAIVACAVTHAFYMPKEADSEPEATETAVGFGDRMDKGDEIAAWARLDVTTTVPATTVGTVSACNAGALLEVELGAVALAAGSAAFAAALAF